MHDVPSRTQWQINQAIATIKRPVDRKVEPGSAHAISVLRELIHCIAIVKAYRQLVLNDQAYKKLNDFDSKFLEGIRNALKVVGTLKGYSQALGHKLQGVSYAVRDLTGTQDKRFHVDPVNPEDYGADIIDVRNRTEDFGRRLDGLLPELETIVNISDAARNKYNAKVCELWNVLELAERKKAELLDLYELAELLNGQFVKAPRVQQYVAPEPEYDVANPAFAKPIQTAAERAWRTGARNPVVLCPERPPPPKRLKSVIVGAPVMDTNEV